MAKIKNLTTGWVKEFKDFALKGNVIDMAIGVIIGGAFGKIVTSLVKDIIMPAFSLIYGDNKSLAELSYQGIKYGNFRIHISISCYIRRIYNNVCESKRSWAQ